MTVSVEEGRLRLYCPSKKSRMVRLRPFSDNVVMPDCFARNAHVLNAVVMFLSQFLQSEGGSDDLDPAFSVELETSDSLSIFGNVGESSGATVLKSPKSMKCVRW